MVVAGEGREGVGHLSLHLSWKNRRLRGLKHFGPSPSLIGSRNYPPSLSSLLFSSWRVPIFSTLSLPRLWNGNTAKTRQASWPQTICFNFSPSLFLGTQDYFNSNCVCFSYTRLSQAHLTTPTWSQQPLTRPSELSGTQNKFLLLPQEQMLY